MRRSGRSLHLMNYVTLCKCATQQSTMITNHIVCDNNIMPRKYRTTRKTWFNKMQFVICSSSVHLSVVSLKHANSFGIMRLGTFNQIFDENRTTQVFWLKEQQRATLAEKKCAIILIKMEPFALVKDDQWQWDCSMFGFSDVVFLGIFSFPRAYFHLA